MGFYDVKVSRFTCTVTAGITLMVVLIVTFFVILPRLSAKPQSCATCPPETPTYEVLEKTNYTGQVGHIAQVPLELAEQQCNEDASCIGYNDIGILKNASATQENKDNSTFYKKNRKFLVEYNKLDDHIQSGPDIGLGNQLSGATTTVATKNLCDRFPDCTAYDTNGTYMWMKSFASGELHDNRTGWTHYKKKVKT
jgi:hypothetical protein